MVSALLTVHGGCYIVLEGLDGSGKSMQHQMLVAELRKRWSVFPVHEPGHTDTGRKIRDILLHDRSYLLNPMAETLLFAADSAMTRTSVSVALEAGAVVVSDRGVGSALAYGTARGMAEETVSVYSKIGKGTRPDLNVFLDVPMEVLRERLKFNSPDKVEMNGERFFQDVENAYHLMRTNLRYCHLTGPWVSVDGIGTAAEVGGRVLEAVYNAGLLPRS